MIPSHWTAILWTLWFASPRFARNLAFLAQNPICDIWTSEYLKATCRVRLFDMTVNFNLPGLSRKFYFNEYEERSHFLLRDELDPATAISTNGYLFAIFFRRYRLMMKSGISVVCRVFERWYCFSVIGMNVTSRNFPEGILCYSQWVQRVSFELALRSRLRTYELRHFLTGK